MELSHINAAGEANMVDVGAKDQTERSALASGVVLMRSETLTAIKNDGLAKGEVLAVARVAGIQAAKKCSDLIPLCHPLMLTSVEVVMNLDSDNSRVIIEATCKVNGPTGVEMEALTAVSVSALTIYDMCKAVDKEMTIGDISLLEKQGGRSGHLWLFIVWDLLLDCM